MKYFLFLVSLIIINSCGQNSRKKELLREWILAHESELVSASDTLIRDYRKDHPETDWVSADVAITNSMSGSLGLLADKAGDTTNCVVVELTIFKNPDSKRRIFLVATDSSHCLNKLNEIQLTTDSTKNIVFGKREVGLQ